MLAGCGAEDLDIEEPPELGQTEEALSAACGGDDSNSLAAGLAVAIANELGRWDVSTDFVVSNGKLELSPTGKLHCSNGCPKVTALLRLQDDTSSSVPNHIPATYRSKLTSWYSAQKTALTRLVDEMLNVDQGVYRIRSRLSGKHLAPAGGSASSGAAVQQSDQYSNTTAAQWRVHLKGTSQQLINVKSGLCMDLQTDSSSRVNIVQRPCNGSATQNFRLGQLDAGVLTVRSKFNLAFTPSGSSTGNNVNIVHDTVRGATNEHFYFEPYGRGGHRDLLETSTAVYSMKVAQTGMGLAVSSSSTADNVSVVQQPYSATDDRFHWYITQLGTVNINNVKTTTYQVMNRRTGKCLDLSGKNIVQRTCSTSKTQRFTLAPTGNLRQVAYTTNGYTMGIQNRSSASGARLVEENTKTWEMNNMVTFEPIIAIEPHRLVYSHTTSDGPCGNYDWYDISQPNGLSLDDPAASYVQLIFAGGKQTERGSDLNPYIAQKVSGDLVAIDPVYGLNASGVTTTGACAAACVSVSSTNLSGKCCSCQGKSKKFAKAAWNASTYVCQ